MRQTICDLKRASLNEILLNKEMLPSYIKKNVIIPFPRSWALPCLKKQFILQPSSFPFTDSCVTLEISFTMFEPVLIETRQSITVDSRPSLC